MSIGPYITPAITRAVAAINARSDVLNNTELKWVWHDSQCDVNAAIGAWMDMALYYNVSAIIGPACNDPGDRLAGVVEYWEIPLILRRSPRGGSSVTSTLNLAC